MKEVRKKLLTRKAPGVAAVEFALILPIFLTILFAVMDFGWMFFQQLVITSAARAGARAGALAATDSEAPSAAQEAVIQYISENGLGTGGVSVTAPVQTGATPKTITVTVTMQFDPLIGVLFLPDSIQPYPSELTARAVMAREQ